MWSELKGAFRRLWRRPSWLFGSILALALGIGANAAAFAVLRAFLFQPLPVPESERLALLWEERAEKDWAFAPVSPADFLDWRGAAKSFSGMTAYSVETLDSALTGRGKPLLVRHLPVFGDFFNLIGASFVQGRGFEVRDTLDPREAVAVVSERLWRRLGDPGLLGAQIVLGGTSYKVVGVTRGVPPFPSMDIDVWTPLYWPAPSRGAAIFRQAHNLLVVGRLASERTWTSARAELVSIASRLEAAFPATNGGLTAGLMPLRSWIVKDFRLSVLVLWGASGLVFLLACVNSANLQLLRTLEASRDIAVRAALGATPAELLRLTLIEGAVVALLGGVCGGALALLVTASFFQRFPDVMPPSGPIRLDVSVLLFTFVLSVLATATIGAVSLKLLSRRALAALLRDGGSSTAGVGKTRVLKGLLALEAAFASSLLLSGGLFLRSLEEVRRVDLGFVPDRVTKISVSLPWGRYRTPERRAGFYRDLLAKLQQLPGAQEVALADAAPLSGLRWTGTLEREPASAGVPSCELHHRVVSPGYFKTLGVHLQKGSGFSSKSYPGPGEVVLNRRLAETCFGVKDPLGNRVRFLREGAQDSGWLTIVGVTGNERVESVTEPPVAELFEPFEQAPPTSVDLLVRASVEPAALGRQIEAAVLALDPDLPTAQPRSLEEDVRRSTAQPRLLLAVVGSLALLAATLAGVGVYSVTAYALSQRRREIAIRHALGAAAGTTARLLARGTVGAVLIGSGAGLLGAVVFARAARTLLFGITPIDAPALLFALAGIGIAIVLPAYLAARRATAIPATLPLQPL